MSMDDTITPESFLLECIAEDERGTRGCSSPVLAQCAAYRAILRDRARSDALAGDTEWHMGYSDGNYDAIRALAAVYADRPGYDEAWR